jgi:hypothetical protein
MDQHRSGPITNLINGTGEYIQGFVRLFVFAIIAICSGVYREIPGGQGVSEPSLTSRVLEGNCSGVKDRSYLYVPQNCIV